MATTPTKTANTLVGPALAAAPVNGTALVGLATTAEEDPAATPGAPPAGAGGGLVAAA